MAVLNTRSGFQTESGPAPGMGTVGDTCTVQGGPEKQGVPLSPLPLQIQATSEIQENGEEAPGLGPSLDRMLSSSSSVSSLNSSTVKD